MFGSQVQQLNEDLNKGLGSTFKKRNEEAAACLVLHTCIESCRGALEKLELRLKITSHDYSKNMERPIKLGLAFENGAIIYSVDR